MVVVANGPGEVSGWAVPMARAAAQWAASMDRPVTLSLLLPPCQVSSGQEAAFAQRQALFHRIFTPRDCLAFVIGWRRFPGAGPGCVLHMGGDLWYSATLARRFGFPAFAYAETTLIRKRWRRFERVFLPSLTLADRLIVRGVPAERLSVVGDVRVEYLQAIRRAIPPGQEGVRLALLPGSRPWIVDLALPYLLDLVPAIRAQRPDVRFSLILSPFLSPRDVARVLAWSTSALRDLGIDVVDEDRLHAMAQCTLALTYPGTNTVELGVLGVPMLVVLPLHRPTAFRTPGLNEWLSRIPGMATIVKSAMIAWYTRTHKLLAWPNRTAGRMVVPEIVGRITSQQVVRQTLKMLDDPPALERMSRDLRALYPPSEGATARILEEMAPFLQPVGRSSG
jgi:hypothetical protein